MIKPMDTIIIDRQFKDEPTPSAMLLIEEIQNLKEECIMLNSQLIQKAQRHKYLTKKLYLKHKIRFRKDGTIFKVGEISEKGLTVQNEHLTTWEETKQLIKRENEKYA